MLQCTKQETPKENIFTFQENKTQDSFQNLILRFTTDQRKPLQQIRSRSLNKVCTHRKHFEDLQPIRSPAFLGFVYWQRKVNIPGILREEQHQKDSPVEKKQSLHLIPHYFTAENSKNVCMCIFYGCWP